MMDPFTAALIAGAASKFAGGAAKAGSQFLTGRSLMLDEEQQKRLKELERAAATGELGLTPTQMEGAYTQVLTPVQAAERQALANFAATQSIGDIGQGAAFRQQQALKEGSEMQRQQAAQLVAQKQQEEAARQDQERLRLKEQERRAQDLQRQAALSLLSAGADAAFGAAQMKAEKAMAEEIFNKRMDQLSKGDQKIVEGAQQLLDIPAPKPQQDQPPQPPPTQDQSQAELNKIIDRITKGKVSDEMVMPRPKDFMEFLEQSIGFGRYTPAAKERMRREFYEKYGYTAPQYERNVGDVIGQTLAAPIRALTGGDVDRGAPGSAQNIVRSSEKTPAERLQLLGQQVASDIASSPAMTMGTQLGEQFGGLVSGYANVPKIGEIFYKPNAKWGYELVAFDANGDPIFDFVKSDGTRANARFGKGTPQYDEAVQFMGLVK